MFVEILIALSCLLIQPTIHHFIGNFDECTASKVCNHTWTPVCGHLEEESSYRLFLDDCDLHEYNCDNKATYVEVDTKVCSTKCTQRDQAEMATTAMAPAPLPLKVSTTMTTEDIKTETTKIKSTKEVTATTKDKTDTSTIFVAPTTLEMTTEEPKTTNKQTSEVTTKATATTTETTDITNVYTSSDVTTVKLVIETTTATVLPAISNENNINDDENTIHEETTRLTSVVTPAKLNLDCYPNRCSMPSTWETTSVGETRDFVQILKERYGDGISFLRDTTHFPKQPTYARKREAFIPGYHMERRNQQYYANKLET